jgi:metal-responsive CopG/Arc/MetJ family transcriptional regulator
MKRSRKQRPVRERLTFTLSAGLRRQVDRIAARDGVSRSEVLRASLGEYLFARRLRALRQRMVAAARARGIHTDEDVFERVS